MSEPVAQDAQISSAEVERALADAAAAGAMLRQAREQAGMHVAALAVSLKVPVHKLEALEVGDLGVFPDAVFVRALVSSICRTLKIDAAPVLALLPQNQAPGFPPTRASTHRSSRGPPSSHPRPPRPVRARSRSPSPSCWWPPWPWSSFPGNGSTACRAPRRP